MKIAQIAPINLPIPSNKGGLERIMDDLITGLRIKKQQIDVFTVKRSHCSHKINLFDKEVSGSYMRDPESMLLHLTHLTWALSQSKKYDLIHCHINYLPYFLMPFIKTPIIITAHNPLFKDQESVRKNLINIIQPKYLIAISNSQAKTGIKNMFYATIPNGINLKKFTLKFKKTRINEKKYLLFVGRLEQYKGAHIAIQIAKATKLPLYIIGAKSNNDLNYFQKEIKPYVNNKNIFYIPAVGTDELKRYYQNAFVLLSPILWDEPFGLVATEAMACGTPVCAFRRGAYREIIPEKLLIKKNSITDMIYKINELKNYSDIELNKLSIDLRKIIENKYSVDAMIDNYIKTYKRVLKDWNINQENCYKIKG